MNNIRQMKNAHGSTFPITPYIQRFLDDAKVKGGQVLDIGATFGVTSFPCLNTGCEVNAYE